MEDQYLSVTALTKYIKKKFDVDEHLNELWLRGEISNFKHHSRGHMYMTIKDDYASIRAVMFQRQNHHLNFQPESGMTVLIKGFVSVFESQGQYQLYIQEMQPDGIGAFYLAYEQLKEKLSKEGLFDKIHKQPLPKYPQNIAVITSPTGAAIRDILTTLERRYPIANVLIIPVLVQGKQAPSSIVKGIQQANSIPEIDLIITGRGGGSLEELWSFNEEEVARAIFASDLPVVSAVGHETDVTISDMVADLRAPTPTAAAELTVPSQLDLMEKIKQSEQTMLQYIRNKLQLLQDKVKSINNSYVFKYPERLVLEKEQRLIDQTDRLSKQLERVVQRKQEHLQFVDTRYERLDPLRQLSKQQEQIEEKYNRLQRITKQQFEQKRNQFSNTLMQLDLLNPVHIMRRGYSVTYNQEQQIIKSVEQVQPEEGVTIQLHDGELDATIIETRKGDSSDGIE
ncbi:exodeoxyribonuclease VII large subunit [Gracilibacillus timonensis]|uniref:exodeoxyribonuclease VII large subunit n=1 Tax=Gracilibacillus timonensis TaxID=1816696 RepID=UPI000825A467|nr:exodeoxyribonuclease VII large subunit [Gracilibacillus timonensis]